MYFVYGWPFDSAEVIGGSPKSFELVDKEPSYWLLILQRQHWQSEGQYKYFIPYKITTYVIILVVLYRLFGKRMLDGLHGLLFTENEVCGTATRLPYSSIAGIDTYCPVLSLQESLSPADKSLIFADISNIKLKHCVQLPCAAESENKKRPLDLFNLSLLLPKSYWKTCLGVVKYYKNVDDDEENEDVDQSTDSNLLQQIAKTNVQTNKVPFDSLSIEINFTEDDAENRAKERIIIKEKAHVKKKYVSQPEFASAVMVFNLTLYVVSMPY